ncbi:MAG: hypothetical protein K2N67_01190 [Mucispirillum sp.]|nr:hypothetical protein [Mucispirillum sp.]
MKNKDTQKYWDNQAKVYGMSGLDANSGTISFNMEIDDIKKHITIFSWFLFRTEP